MEFKTAKKEMHTEFWSQQKRSLEQSRRKYNNRNLKKTRGYGGKWLGEKQRALVNTVIDLVSTKCGEIS